MYPDFKELLSVLNEYRVKYLIVGAYALAKFGAPLHGMTAAEFAEPGPFFRMGHAPVGVDILTAIPGVDFDAAWPRRVEAVIDQATGQKATFISRDDLIAAKLASGRLQDIADVDAIRKATESQGTGGEKAL